MRLLAANYSTFTVTALGAHARNLQGGGGYMQGSRQGDVRGSGAKRIVRRRAWTKICNKEAGEQCADECVDWRHGTCDMISTPCMSCVQNEENHDIKHIRQSVRKHSDPYLRPQ